MAFKEKELLPCPFCGEPAVYFYTLYKGPFASGMEPPYVHAGCKSCDISFGGRTTKEWQKEIGYYDNRQAAYDYAADNWNRRNG